MFARLMSLFQTRRSTRFLLDRSDDRLLADIGLTRADLEAMHLGLGQAEARQKTSPRLHQGPPHRGLPSDREAKLERQGRVAVRVLA
eukprot:gene7400-9165_t